MKRLLLLAATLAVTLYGMIGVGLVSVYVFMLIVGQISLSEFGIVSLSVPYIVLFIVWIKYDAFNSWSEVDSFLSQFRQKHSCVYWFLLCLSAIFVCFELMKLFA